MTRDRRPSSPDPGGSGAGKGKVWLVGAGPGDPGLITVAGLERLREADVLVYDRLVSPQLLKETRAGAELIFAGKEGGGPHWDQDAINRLLVEKAKQGKRVVRLKGGDPFVFGRGGEEAQALRAAGVPFEVVPGVTSATAVPAYAGIPVTHRGLSSSFAVITGHEAEHRPVGRGPSHDPAEPALQWDKLAGIDTLIVLMGTKTLSTVVDKLLENGRPPDTPAAVVRWGTTPDQRTVTGTLADIVQRAEQAGLTPPTVAVVGEVVRMREALSWYENRPLFGKRVLITRTRRQAGALARLLALEGAVPVELPAIEVEPLEDAAATRAAIAKLRAGGFAWAVFTSANAVDLFFEALKEGGLDARAFAETRVAAIGPATAAALAECGITADAVPDEYIAEGTVEALRPHLKPDDAVLVPRAEGARPELVEGLRALGAEVEEVLLYRSAVPRSAPAEALEMLRRGEIDIVTFTSSSTVRNLAALLGEDFRVILSHAYRQAGGEGVGTRKVVPSRRDPGSGAGGVTTDERRAKPLIACIGPVTAKAAAEVLGRPPDVVASAYTVPGLVEAIRQHFGRTHV
ncbi:MAG: uroporphyrinogen-III C-methyltransferase [Chloroflexi bacterium]|nr:uroporphyrinogen-III C-methyltransferase [Chloroflexota bacterium]